MRRPQQFALVVAMALRCMVSVAESAAISNASSTNMEDFVLRMRIVQHTTQAYKREATKVLLAEASEIARNLQLPEKLPIQQGDLREIYIQSPSWSDQDGMFGTISTANYIYSASLGNRISSVDSNPQGRESYLSSIKQQYTAPKSQMHKDTAHNLATNWLAAAGVDISALERDCKVQFHVRESGDSFVPVFWVMWRRPSDSVGPKLNHDDGQQTVAAVWLVVPERKLLQLDVSKSTLFTPEAFSCA